MQHLHIDIETFCRLDVGDVGVYRYSEDGSFKVLLFAYAFDGEPVTVVDCSDDEYPGESIPTRVWRALTDPAVLKVAHNANFELTCLSTFYGLPLGPAQWFCTMVGALYLGLPKSLGEVSKVLGLSDQKDTKGKSLITYFCKPCKPTKKNGGRTVNLPADDPERWELFKEYNAQDVRTEVAIFNYLQRFPGLSDTERKYWVLDQHINGTGITVDREFVEAAIATNNRFTAEVHAEIRAITGIDNPNSLPQLKRWLADEMGHGSAGFSLNKEALEDYANSDHEMPANVKRVLRLRQLGSKSSISKYDTMRAYLQLDGRVRGQLQYYGANRTGRFAGQGIQVQNLKRTIKGKAKLETAREAVRKGFADLLYDDVADIISRLTRTALVAAEGCSLVVSDFSAIEARVLAWEAGEEWVLEVFRTHGKIYEATAANMFNVPIRMVTKESDLRAKGKVATLALGYQGASGALIKMGALREGLTEAELPALVSAWRAANPRIVKLWRNVEQTAKHVIEKKTSYLLRLPYCALRFIYDRGYLFIELPSGRRLAYYGATVKDGRLRYWGVDQLKKIWVQQDTYGGSLVENITQAIARDCLCDALLRVHEAGITILMHIHDEIVCEAVDTEAEDTLARVNGIMAISPVWAGGLPLKGDGYISKYYKKD